MKYFMLILVLLGFTQMANAETLGFSMSAQPVQGRDLVVTVLDEETGLVLEGADVRFEQGSANSVLSVYKKGYGGITLIGKLQPQITVFLKPIPKEVKDVFFRGNMGEWKIDHGRDKVSLGLVYKTLGIFDLINFTSSVFVSPFNDEIDVMGSRKVPSNLLIPKQKVTVVIAPVTLNKPEYRFPVAADRASHLTSIKGVVPVKALIGQGTEGEGRGIRVEKINMDVLNKVQFSDIGLSDAVQPGAQLETHLDVPASVKLVKSHDVVVSKPPFAADVLVASFYSSNGDKNILVPTDVKSVPSGSQAGTLSLVAPESALPENKGILSVAVAEGGKRLSGIVNFGVGKTLNAGAFINVPAPESLASIPEETKLLAPAEGIASVQFEGAYPETQESSEKRFAYWTVFALPSAGAVSFQTSRIVKEVGRTPLVTMTQTWMELAGGINEASLDGKTVMYALKRFARVRSSIGKNPLQTF